MLPEIWSATDILTIKIWNKCKKPGDIILSHMCTVNEDHMMYGYSDIRHDRQFFVILGHFLPFEIKILNK